MHPLPPPIPYELRIGVTGHRRLANTAEVELAVERVLGHIRETLQSATREPRGRCGPRQGPWQQVLRWFGKGLKWFWRSLPITADLVPEAFQTPIEWTVVSPLAKGADRLVAAAVLKQEPARLEVLSPFALAEYRTDFVEPDDRQEFETLLEQADDVRVLPAELEAATAEERAALRNEAYFDVGRKTVDECEILIAIWNGKPAAGVGGTGDVVRYALQAGRLVIWIDSERPGAPARALHLADPNKKHSAAETVVLDDIVARPLPDRGKELSAGFHQLSSYNRDAAWNPVQSQKIYDGTLQQWIRHSAAAHLPDRWLRNIADAFLPHLARADQLAIRYQQLYVIAATWLFYLAAAAVTVAVVQNLFFPHLLSLVWLEIGCMVATLFLLGLSQQGAYHVKWLNDRLLAEHIRLSFFGALAGIRDTASEARRNSHLPFYRSADNWAFDVIDQLLDECPASAVTERGQGSYFPALKRFLLDAWILDQANWHRKNAHRKHAVGHRAHRLGLCLFVTTLIMAVVHLSGFGHGSHGEDQHHAPGHTAEHYVALTIAALAMVLPAWAGAVHAINMLLERERIAERSAQMSSVLFEIARRIERTTTLEELQIEVRRARDVQLAENQEWLASLRFRPPVLPG